MRIAFDAHAIGSRLTGNETYARNLLRALFLRSAGGAHEFVVYLKRVLPEGAIVPAGENARFERILSDSRVRRLFLELPRALRSDRPDVLHVQYVAPRRTRGVPVVASVHDISFERHPEWFTRREHAGFRILIPRTARRAAIVLALSEFTRNELLAEYALDPERVVTAPPGVGPEFFPRPDAEVEEALSRLGIGRPFVLAIGNVQPRKNLERVVRAFLAVVEAKEFDGRLVLAGQAGHRGGEILESALRLGRGAVSATGYLPTDDLARLLTACSAFVYPSLYEGYGLPVLEAMACGAPVVTSSTTSLPEAAGGAALLAPPSDENAIAIALKRVLTEPKLAMRLRTLGRERAARASWDETAGIVLEAYSRAAGR